MVLLGLFLLNFCLFDLFYGSEWSGQTKMPGVGRSRLSLPLFPLCHYSVHFSRTCELVSDCAAEQGIWSFPYGECCVFGSSIVTIDLSSSSCGAVKAPHTTRDMDLTCLDRLR